MDSRQKKILILYAAIGLGHKSIAENIAFHLTRAGYEAKPMDVQKTQGGTLAKAGKVFYQWMIQAWPGLWDFFYNTKWFINLTLPGRIKVAAKNHSEILNVLQAFSPDMVICTHTTASAIMSYIKQQGLYRGVFAIAFSDFHLHPYWLYQNADAYLACCQQGGVSGPASRAQQPAGHRIERVEDLIAQPRSHTQHLRGHQKSTAAVMATAGGVSRFAQPGSWVAGRVTVSVIAVAPVRLG